MRWLLVKYSPRWKSSRDISEKNKIAPETMVSGAAFVSGAECSRTPIKTLRPATNKAAKAKSKNSAVESFSGVVHLPTEQVKTTEIFAQAAVQYPPS